MGILIGKAHETLTEYDVTNQSVDNSRFQTKNRSINKTLQSYAWKEKSSIKYDLDFIEDDDFKSLTYLIANKSSLHEGYITVPIPYSNEKTKCIHSFGGVINPSSTDVVKQYNGIKTVDTFNPTTDGTEITTVEYSDISTYDDGYGEFTNTGSGNWLTFEYNISDFLSTFSYQEVKRFTLAYFGMKSSPIKFYLWDYLNESWYNIEDFYYYDETQFEDPSFALNYQMAATFSLPFGYANINDNFISSGKIMFGVQSSSTTEPMIAQYVKMFINGYQVIIDDPESFDYRDYFTGMGRRGQLSLLEI